MYSYETSVKLHDTDAAGLLFFAHQLTMVHDAYESFMESVGFSLASVIRESNFLIAIVHTEADFTKPLYVGDQLKIELTVEKLGDSSYTLVYELLTDNQESAGKAKTVHVCIDKESRKKKSLPEGLRAAFEKA